MMSGFVGDCRSFRTLKLPLRYGSAGGHIHRSAAAVERDRREAEAESAPGVARTASWLEEDLVLATASRAAQDREVVDLAIRMLRAIASDPVMSSSNLLGIMPQVFPWIRFLPGDEQMEFARELVEVMSAGEGAGSPAPVLRTITEWRNTAQIYADPELLETLRSRVIADAGDVAALPEEFASGSRR
jgi:hypothetical protein